MPLVFIGLFALLIFGKVRALQAYFHFSGDVANMPPKLMLFALIFGCILRIVQGKKSEYKIYPVEKAMLVSFGLFTLCGTISAILFHYQTKFYPQFMDVVNYIAFFLGFYCTIFFYQDVSKEELKRWLMPSIQIAKILTIVTLLCWLPEQLVGLDMTSHDTSGRFFPPYQFIYYHGTYFITMVAFCSILVYREEKIHTILLCILCILSARDRGYMFLMLFIAFSYLSKHDKLSIKSLIPLVILVGIAGGAISFKKIVFYTDEDSIRASFYIVAAILAAKHFPFGAGWCTIGTWNSYRYNSPIFDQYSQFFVWADEKDTVYADSGFSSIIGQTGLFGTICYLAFMITLFFSFLKRFILFHKARAVVLSWVVFNMVSYFVSDSMVSNFFVTSSFFLGIIYLIEKKELEEKESENHSLTHAKMP